MNETKTENNNTMDSVLRSVVQHSKFLNPNKVYTVPLVTTFREHYSRISVALSDHTVGIDYAVDFQFLEFLVRYHPTCLEHFIDMIASEFFVSHRSRAQRIAYGSDLKEKEWLLKWTNHDNISKAVVGFNMLRMRHTALLSRTCDVPIINKYFMGLICSSTIYSAVFNFLASLDDYFQYNQLKIGTKDPMYFTWQINDDPFVHDYDSVELEDVFYNNKQVNAWNVILQEFLFDPDYELTVKMVMQAQSHSENATNFAKWKKHSRVNWSKMIEDTQRSDYNHCKKKYRASQRKLKESRTNSILDSQNCDDENVKLYTDAEIKLAKELIAKCDIPHSQGLLSALNPKNWTAPFKHEHSVDQEVRGLLDKAVDAMSGLTNATNKATGLMAGVFHSIINAASSPGVQYIFLLTLLGLAIYYKSPIMMNLIVAGLGYIAVSELIPVRFTAALACTIGRIKASFDKRTHACVYCGAHNKDYVHDYMHPYVNSTSSVVETGELYANHSASTVLIKDKNGNFTDHFVANKSIENITKMGKKPCISISNKDTRNGQLNWDDLDAGKLIQTLGIAPSYTANITGHTKAAAVEDAMPSKATITETPEGRASSNVAPADLPGPQGLTENLADIRDKAKDVFRSLLEYDFKALTRFFAVSLLEKTLAIKDMTLGNIKPFMLFFANFDRALSGFSSFMEYVKEAIDAIVNFIGKYVFGAKRITLFPVGIKLVDEWKSDIDSLLHDRAMGKFKLDLQSYNRTLNLRMRGEAIHREYAVLGGSTTVKELVSRYLNHLRPIQESLATANLRGTQSRMEPLAVCIVGASGTGKSQMSLPFVEALLAKVLPSGELESYRRNPSEQIYQRSAEHVYWDGYKGQKCCIFDDLFQSRDVAGVPDSEAMNIIRCAGSFPYICHMAGIDQKGNTQFTSNIMYASSNMERFDPQSIHFAEAVVRRFDFTYKVSIKPEYAISRADDSDKPLGSINIPKVRENFGRGFITDIYEFSRINLSTGQVYAEPSISYQQLLDRCVSKYEEKMSAAELFLQELKDRREVIIESRESIDNNPVQNNNMYQEIVDYENDPNNIGDKCTCFGNADSDDSFDDFEALITKLQNKDLPRETTCPFVTSVKVDKVHLALWTSIWNGDVKNELRSAVQRICNLNDMGLVYLDSKNGGEYFFYTFCYYLTKMNKNYIIGSNSFTLPQHLRALALIFPSDKLNNILHSCASNSCEIPVIVNECQLHGETMWAKFKEYTYRVYEEYQQPLKYLGMFAGGVLLLGTAHKIFKTLGKNMKSDCYKSKYLADSSDDSDVDPDDSISVVGERTPANAESHELGHARRHNMHNTKRGQRSGGKAGRGNQRPQGFEEGNAAMIKQHQPTDDFCTSLLKKSCYELVSETGRVHGSILMLKDRLALMPLHFKLKFLDARDNEAGSPISYYLKNTSLPHNQREFKLTNDEFLNVYHSHELEECDLCILRLPTRFQPASDITKHFISNDAVSESNSWSVGIYRLSGSVITVKASEAEFVPSVRCADPSMTIYNISNAIKYNAMTKTGDCGAVIAQYTTNPRAGKLMGIHVAGSQVAGGGYAPLVTREFIQEQISFFKEGVNNAVPQCLFDDRLFGREDMPKFTTVYDAPYRSTATAIRKTKLHNTYWTTTKDIARQRPFLNSDGVKVDPFQRAFAKYVKNYPIPEKDILDQATADFRHHMDLNGFSSEKYSARIITFDECLNGCDDIVELGPMPRNTSPGYPFNGTRIKLDKAAIFGTDSRINTTSPHYIKFMKDLTDIEINLAQGKDTSPLAWRVFSFFLKDERRLIKKVEEGSTRGLGCCNWFMYMLFKKYFGHFMAVFTKYNLALGHAIGLDPFTGAWDNMTASLLARNADFACDGDFSNFDSCSNPLITHQILIYIQDWYGDEHFQMRKMLWSAISFPQYLVDDKLVTLFGGMPSGNPLTAMLNCCNNMLIWRYTWYDIMRDSPLTANPFAVTVCLKVMGDDLILSILNAAIDSYTPMKIRSSFASIGYTFTMADKSQGQHEWKHISQCTFLKRGFRRDVQLRTTVAPLELDTILDIPMWYNKGNNEAAMVRTNVEVAFNELSLHDDETYTKWTSKIAEAVKQHYGHTLFVPKRTTLLSNIMGGEKRLHLSHLEGSEVTY